MSFQSVIKKLIFALLVLTQIYSNELPPPNDHEERGWIVSADFLAWFASQEVASIWTDAISAKNWDAPSFNFKWDYGFRLGVGHDLEYDQWDAALYWTWFRTDATHKISSTQNKILQPEFFAGFLSGDIPQGIRTHWSLFLNMFDAELGKSYWASNALCMRPFLGLKGGWIHQSIESLYNDLFIVIFQTTESAKEHLKNNFWGIGPLGGLNTKWKLSNCFNLFADISLASLFGNWKNSDVYRNTIGITTRVNTKNSSLGSLMFRALFGLGWDFDFKSSHCAAKFGFETQFWTDQLRIATFQLQRLHNDLSLQGIALNAELDF